MSTLLASQELRVAKFFEYAASVSSSVVSREVQKPPTNKRLRAQLGLQSCAE
jgi:hypothetical protein